MTADKRLYGKQCVKVSIDGDTNKSAAVTQRVTQRVARPDDRGMVPISALPALQQQVDDIQRQRLFDRVVHPCRDTPPLVRFLHIGTHRDDTDRV